MAECEYLNKCPVFEKCQSGVLKSVFVTMYCKGSKLEDCARRKLKKAGKEVPLCLLPDGKIMESLGK